MQMFALREEAEASTMRRGLSLCHRLELRANGRKIGDFPPYAAFRRAWRHNYRLSDESAYGLWTHDPGGGPNGVGGLPWQKTGTP